MEADLRAVVYVSWGIWVARCPADGCPQAEHYGADRNTGHVGGLGATLFECRHCGLVCPAVWPTAQVRASVVRLLAMRPVPATRNWLPGETPEELLIENVSHGLIADHELPAGRVMVAGRMHPQLAELVDARATAVRMQSRLAIGA